MERKGIVHIKTACFRNAPRRSWVLTCTNESLTRAKPRLSENRGPAQSP